MSNTRGLTKENLLFTFPAGLRENPSIAALGDVTMEALAKRPAEINRISIYPRIDELPEKLLDILAYDFKVDWWDTDYSLEEKRRVFKTSWYVHKHLGTKAAVETAIRAIYPLTTVEEWFEYEGGQPYHFRLRINITSDSGDKARQKRVLERLNFYKNLRSHVDEVKYFLMPEKSWAVAGGGFVGSREIARAEIAVPPLKRPGSEVITIAGGGLAGMRSVDRASIRIPPLDKPGGSAAVSTGGALRGMCRKINTTVGVPELLRPQGTAGRAETAGCIGSAERVTVKLNASNVKVPTGRAATGGTAGVFHSYQRIQVSVGIPATA